MTKRSLVLIGLLVAAVLFAACAAPVVDDAALGDAEARIAELEADVNRLAGEL